MSVEDSLRIEAVDIKAFGNHLLEKDMRAFQELKDSLDFDAIQKALDIILACEGHILVTGSGTSSTIARRLAHTLTCSGVPSYFLDAGQSIHGYSAIITDKDVLIGFSRGGETDEVNFVAKIARKRGAKVISILENPQSTFAKLSDLILHGAVRPENEPINTIPLANTLVQAALGDILCGYINILKGFDPDEFGKFHPGGAVGKRLASE